MSPFNAAGAIGSLEHMSAPRIGRCSPSGQQKPRR
jgi:hypothetical protein